MMNSRWAARLVDIQRQNGYVTLTISLIVLFMLTTITFISARVSMTEQKISANEFWASQAMQVAEMGLEQGIAYLNQNREMINSNKTGGWMEAGKEKWTPCSSSNAKPPCGDGQKNLYGGNWLNYPNVTGTVQPTASTDLPSRYAIHYLTRCRDDDYNNTCDDSPAGPEGKSVPVINVIVEGFSDVPAGITDLTELRDQARGFGYVRQTAFFSSMVGNIPAPLIASGMVPLGGNYHIVTNPDLRGDASNIPLSIWAKSAVDVTSAATQTCYVDEFLKTDSGKTDEDGIPNNKEFFSCPQCTCPLPSKDVTGGNISFKTGSDFNKNEDILDDDPNFPTDLFKFVFGIPKTDYKNIEDEAKKIAGHWLSDCSTLDQTSGGLYWITGVCDLNKTSVGSFFSPVLIVAEGGFQIQGTSTAIWGLLFAFSPSGSKPTAHFTGTPTLYGSMIIDGDVDFGGGTYRIRYSTEVLSNLDNLITAIASTAPGSWSDL